MDIASELSAINWPEAFVVHYRDGRSERLLRADGVTITPPGDDPNGIGGLTASIPEKHPRNQQILRWVSLADLLAIQDERGNSLFPTIQ